MIQEKGMEWMKKSVFAFAVLLCCTGCASQTAVSTEGGESQAVGEAALKIENEEYQLETDNQIYLGEAKIVVTEDGYYFVDDEFLYFHDQVQDVNVPVCTQVNCTHTGDECDAYFDFRQYRMEQGIWYDRGYLYFLGSDSSFKEYTLCRVKADGTGRETLTSLFELEGEDESLYSTCVHRGYLYYTLSNDDFSQASQLYRVSLKNPKAPEVIYTGENEYTQIYRIKGYGDGIFFQVGYNQNGEIDEASYRASLEYITNEKVHYHVLDGPQKDYNIIDHSVYYTENDCVRKYDWTTGEDTLFADTGRICNISFDSAYIYLDDYYGVILDDKIPTSGRTISVWNREGEMVESWNIPTASSQLCLFGDERYLWMEWYEGSLENRVLKAFDKTQIGTGSSQWVSWTR